MQVQSLGGEDPLEKEIATHSSILAWEIPWTVEPGRLQPMLAAKQQPSLPLYLYTAIFLYPHQVPITTTLPLSERLQKHTPSCGTFLISKPALFSFYQILMPSCHVTPGDD